MYDVANKVKSYVKQLYGPRSPQYKQINALKFTKPYPAKKKKPK
ncbi:MAG: hypothetical protein K0S32_2789 [Bacteroidetes bacterium]|jgi:hypothetical protein|nr:hypothetical protein [Bacteroidota bacterium]